MHLQNHGNPVLDEHPALELEKLSIEQFAKFSDFIYRQCGVRVDAKKITMLSNRIRRRLKAGDFRDFAEYYRYLTSKSGAEELRRFLDVITTHETSFFRTSKQFDWLRNEFVSEMIAQHDAGQREASMKIWSAGCSNGAEAFSIAICLIENRYRLRAWQLRIVGTDISEENIQAAREGKFKQRCLQAVSESRLRQHFRKESDGSWRIRSTASDLVQFQTHNLMLPFQESEFDCIFIRNVLIYFDATSKATAIRNLIAALAPGGYLVVGPSEGVYELLNSLEKVSPLIYRKPGRRGSSPSRATQAVVRQSDRTRR